MPKGSGQHVDWNSFAKGKSSSSSPPNKGSIYDGVGPRTTATGGAAAIPPPYSGRCPTILEEPSSTKARPASASRRRDSSASEVTLPEEPVGSYCEPFGKAVPPPPLPPGNKKRGGGPRNRDSIVSVDSDMGGIMAAAATSNSSATSSSSNGACPVHKPPHVTKSEQPRQLKGILKGGSLNKQRFEAREKPGNKTSETLDV